MNPSTIKNRFELDSRYQCVVLLKDGLVLSNNFYLSDDDFLYRKKNSPQDETIPYQDIHKFTYNSVGNIVEIYFENEKRELHFSGNKRQSDFLDEFPLRESFVINEQGISSMQAFLMISPYLILIFILGYLAASIQVAIFISAAFIAIFGIFQKIKKSTFFIYERE